MPTVFLTVLNVSRRERAAEKTSKKVVLSGEERGGDRGSKGALEHTEEFGHYFAGLPFLELY